MSRLKNIYIDCLKTHDWKYEIRPDADFDEGAKEKDFLKSLLC